MKHVFFTETLEDAKQDVLFLKDAAKNGEEVEVFDEKIEDNVMTKIKIKKIKISSKEEMTEEVFLKNWYRYFGLQSLPGELEYCVVMDYDRVK